MRVVINTCYGGFGLSHKAVMRYAELSGFKLYAFVEARDEKGNIDFDHHVPYQEGRPAFVIHYSKKPLDSDGRYEEGSYFSTLDLDRSDPALVQIVEELGKEADGDVSELKVIDIPDGIQFEIDEYDGIESIHEVHQSWS